MAEGTMNERIKLPGGIVVGCRATAFLLIDDDAGTDLGDLSLDELAQIDHLILQYFGVKL